MSRVLLDSVLFLVLLVLVSIQVVVYWSCTNKDGEDGKKGLSYDQAELILWNLVSSHGDMLNLTFTHVSSNCYECNTTPIATLPFNTTYDVTVSTTFPITLHVLYANASAACNNLTLHFREWSSYCYMIQYNYSTSSIDCTLWRVEKGDNAFLPILYAAVVLVSLSFLWVILNFAYRFLYEKGSYKYFHFNFIDRITHRDLGLPSATTSPGRRYRSEGTRREKRPILSHASQDSSVNVQASPNKDIATNQSVLFQLHNADSAKSKRRLISLDAFRGMSLTIMIFVNYGGGGYWFFDHSKWNGLTVADLVFPWFVWIMGVSLVFSSHGRRHDTFLQKLYQIVRRTIILFAVGLFLNTSQDTPITHLRIPGVLQRFSITYLVVALTELLSAPLYKWKNFSLWSPLNDITGNWVQWVMVIVLEGLWLMITFLLNDNECPKGYLGPGGIGQHGHHQNCTGGAAGLVDRWLLGNDHLYDDPTAKDLYQLDLNYDPEGVLGTLNSIVLCYFGVQAGKTLLHFRGKYFNIIARFTLWGLALSILGTALCLGQKNEGLIPLNKNLWSLSFILLMGGTGYLVLAVFYLTIDALHLWSGSPFKYTGMNSIIIYVGHELLGGFFPFSVYNQDHSHLTYLTANLVATTLWTLIAYYWFTLNFFVKI